MKHFKWTPIRNCRKFYKRYYYLNYPIDQELVDELNQFGFLETYKFSDYSKKAKDIFTIKLDGYIELSGAYDDECLQVTVPIESPAIVSEIELIITTWSLKIQYRNQVA